MENVIISQLKKNNDRYVKQGGELRQKIRILFLKLLHQMHIYFAQILQSMAT